MRIGSRGARSDCSRTGRQVRWYPAILETLEPRLLLSADVLEGILDEVSADPFGGGSAQQVVEQAGLDGMDMATTTSGGSRIIATDYATLQEAVDALPNRIGEVYLPVGNYVLTQPLDLTYPAGSGVVGGIKLVGAGSGTRILAHCGGDAAIDLTGASQATIRDLSIVSDTAAYAPMVGILMARSNATDAAGQHHFYNVQFSGQFKYANVYAVGSDLLRFNNCTFKNEWLGSHNIAWGSEDFGAIASPYQGTIQVVDEVLGLRISGCTFNGTWSQAGGSNLVLNGFGMDVSVRDSYISTPDSGYAVTLGTSSQGDPIRGAEFDCVRIEAGNSTNVFNVPDSAENVTIRNSSIFYGSGGSAINADSLSYFTLENNDLWRTAGSQTAVYAENLTDSRIRENVFTFDTQGAEIALAGLQSSRNYIHVADADMVSFTNVQSTLIEAANDDGVYRHYLGDFATGAVLNLPALNTAAIGGQVGDLALDDGTNTPDGRIALAVHDGAQWVYMSSADPLEGMDMLLGGTDLGESPNANTDGVTAAPIDLTAEATLPWPDPNAQASSSDQGDSQFLDGLETTTTSTEYGRVIATHYATLQEAVDALPNRIGEVYIPAGHYVLTETLDLTLSTGYGGGIKLIGAGPGTHIIARTNGQPAIDLTGTSHCYMQDLTIEGQDNETTPNIGLLLARRASGIAAQEHRFENITITGYFTLANVYNITSELDRFVNCKFVNAAPNSTNVIWSSDNIAGITSPYQGEIRTLYSNTEFRMSGCEFYHTGAGGTNLAMVGFTMDTTVRDCYFSAPAGGYAVKMHNSSAGGPVRDTEFDACRFDAVDADKVFYLMGTQENLAIRNCTFLYGENKVIDANRIYAFEFENNDVWNVRGWKTAVHSNYIGTADFAGNRFTFDNIGGANPQSSPEIALSCWGAWHSHISVPRQDMLSISNFSTSIIETTGDGAYRRTTSPQGATFFNLTPVDTSTLTGMQAGDIALDDGTNTHTQQFALAVYSGSDWLYMGQPSLSGQGVVLSPGEGEALLLGQSDTVATGAMELVNGATQTEATEAATTSLDLSMSLDEGGLFETLEAGDTPRVIATDYATLQEAVDALPNRTGEVYMPVGIYTITQTLDLTRAPGAVDGSIKLIGSGRGTRIIPQTSGAPALDLTGRSQCVLKDFNIEANIAESLAPNVGLLMGRNSDGNYAGGHSISNVNFAGIATIANVYNVSADHVRFNGCIFINTGTISQNVAWTPDNYAAVSSPYQGNIYKTGSSQDMRLIACTFYNWGDGMGGANVYIHGGARDLTVRDGYMNPPHAKGYGVHFAESAQGDAIRGALIDSIRIENENGDSVIHVDGNADRVRVRNCTFVYGECRAVRADSLTNFIFENNDMWSIAGWLTAMHIDELYDSRISENTYYWANWGYPNPESGDTYAIRGESLVRSSIQTNGSTVSFTSIDSSLVDYLNRRRWYMGNQDTGCVMNMTPVDTTTLTGMQTGDIALDDGTNTPTGEWGLAVYDGTEWVCMAGEGLVNEVRIDAVDPIASETPTDPARFVITRGTSAGDLLVYYEVGGTAVSGQDYTPPLTGVAWIFEGNRTATITVTPVSDGMPDDAETVAMTIMPAATYNIAPGGENATATIMEISPPPLVVDHQINTGLDQRSRIASIAIHFSQDVTVLEAGLLVHNDTTGLDVELPAEIMTYDPGTSTATWDTSGVTFANGNHTATLVYSSVVNGASNTLPSDYVIDFFRLEGDFNGDEELTAEDIDLLYEAINAQSTDPCYDLDGNGNLAKEDAKTLVREIMGTELGDVDLDGDIDNVDFGAVYGNFTGPGDFGKTWSQGNFDGDGDVDNPDFAEIFGNYTGPLAGGVAEGSFEAAILAEPPAPGVTRGATQAAETTFDLLTAGTDTTKGAGKSDAKAARKSQKAKAREYRAARKQARQQARELAKAQTSDGKMRGRLRRQLRRDLEVDLLADLRAITQPKL